MHNNPYRRRVTTQQLKARPRERERERDSRIVLCRNLQTCRCPKAPKTDYQQTVAEYIWISP